MMCLSLLFIISFSRKPVFLVSGFGGSPLYGTVTDPNAVDSDCPKDMKKILFFDPQAVTSTSTFYNAHPKCQALLMQAYLNKTNNMVTSPPGLKVESSPLGDVSKLLSYEKLIPLLQSTLGYTLGVDLFGVGYNFMGHPLMTDEKYEEMKLKIEELFSSNGGEKAVLIGHSQGSSFVSIFVSNYTTKEWAKKYIDSVIFLSPALGGSTLFNQLWNRNYPPFPDNDEMKKTVSRMPGQHILLPNYEMFGNMTIIYNIDDTNYKNGNATRSIDFLGQWNRFTPEDRVIFEKTEEKYLKTAVPEPPVPSMIVYNDGISTASFYVVYPSAKRVVGGRAKPGDGTIISHATEFICGKWRTSQCYNLHSSSTDANHMKLTSHQKTLNLVTEFINKDKSGPIKAKKALFFVSGFHCHGIFATVTDPAKVPECNPNMKMFQFFPIADINKNLVESGSFPNDACLNKLVRIEMDPSGTRVNFAEGIYTQAQRFGEYDQVSGFDQMLAKAFEMNYTLYRNAWGVGYNSLHHPLTVDDRYNEMKMHIEAHYNETGKKTVLIAFSQGSSFILIFITEYVTKEWAEKYVEAITFCAPAFAGWGTYDRSVKGVYGNSFPNNAEMFKSTTRMPGLHIMMPNEVAFGNTTVIKNFPNTGDNSNATMIEQLLVKLGKMPEESLAIFRLTDKYRKNPLKEPPVPTLVIYNDAQNTPNGYTYNAGTNSVSAFNGKGDGTVSDDGPRWVCSNWQNVTCYNHKLNGLTHINVLSHATTIQKVFEFVETERFPDPTPTPITSNEPVITTTATKPNDTTTATTPIDTTTVTIITDSKDETTIESIKETDITAEPITTPKSSTINGGDDSNNNGNDGRKGLPMSNTVIAVIAVVSAAVLAVIIATCVILVIKHKKKDGTTVKQTLYCDSGTSVL